jgi:hypothetical protein
MRVSWLHISGPEVINKPAVNLWTEVAVSRWCTHMAVGE